jgi:predicted GH43/DUF377 family glycosyl hydrolase
MKNKIFLVLVVLLIFSGCKDEVTPPSNTVQDGKITLKIDRQNTPQNITTVTAYLIRPNFGTITGTLNLLSDSTADLTMNDIAVGPWHLKVDAADSAGVVKYSGETDVTIIEGQTIQVNLTLVPVAGGTGNIYLYVTWGTLPGEWVDYPGNPILYGINGYEINGAYQGKVLFEGDKYKMWFTGLNPGGVGFIEYAESIDGKNWTRPVNHPVLYPGNYDSWDQYSVLMGAVIKVDNQYRLYYCGRYSQYSGWHIGLATSTDGINWTKHPDPVLYAGSGWESKISVSDIIQKDNTFYLYYDGLVYDPPSTYIQYKIGVATSQDGITFTKSNLNPILVPSQAWEGADILSSSVIYENGIFEMVYMNNSLIWGFGKATSSDGITWTKDINNPFFTAEDTYNHWTSWVGFPYYRKLNGQYTIYYSAEFPNHIVKMGLATKN